QFLVLQATFLNTFTQIATALDAKASTNQIFDESRDTLTNTEFDKIFDGLRALADMAQTRDIVRAAQAQQLVNGDAVNQVVRAAIGLTAGLADAVATLVQLQPTIFDANEVFASGSRFKIPI